MSKSLQLFFYSVLTNLTHLLTKNLKRVIETENNNKRDLVTPYMAMEVILENNILMTSPTSSHLIFKHL